MNIPSVEAEQRGRLRSRKLEASSPLSPHVPVLIPYLSGAETEGVTGMVDGGSSSIGMEIFQYFNKYFHIRKSL